MKFITRLPKKKSVRPPPPAEAPRDSATFADGEISPELVPIVTLLSSQAHRRYYEGIFMLYYDLNGDGKPGDRQWKEVYGILTGNQLAYWDVANLAEFKNLPERLLESSSKPNYLNFTDAIFNAMKVLPAAKQQLENVIIVLTTMKNRYIIQFRSFDMLTEWYLALRLATFEYQSLQEAYTGALLSARGLRLSDIRTILAEKRFNHQDWVKIRYGSGMAWKRCYAVIEPLTSKRKKFIPGRIVLYENETMKKKALMGVITHATLVTAVYPQLPFFIDQSTIMKLEGAINFDVGSGKPKKKDHNENMETSLFLMPELHSAVPGFDTLIRFLIPLFDAFGLYGRPAMLKADRIDPQSLLFGLPTLPHVHYLNLSDLESLTGSDQYLEWDARTWKNNLKRVLQLKLAQGYEGCGSARGFLGAINSLNSPLLASPGTAKSSPTTIRLVSGPAPTDRILPAKPRTASGFAKTLSPPAFGASPAGAGASQLGQAAPVSMPQIAVLGEDAPKLPPSDPNREVASRGQRNVNNLAIDTEEPTRKSLQLADIYHKYSKIQTPSDRFNDRNEILNGSAEELDEEALPSLMRKKSLMHGPYPTTERHLLNASDDDEEEEQDDDDEDDDYSSASLVQKERPLNTGLLVPSVERLEQSHSPNTQYSEFNKQFSQAVDRRYDTELSGSEELSPPPSPPRHSQEAERFSGLYQAQQLPQIQQIQQLRSQQTVNAPLQSPSAAQTSFSDQHRLAQKAPPQQTQQTQMGPKTAIQKSSAVTNLSHNLMREEVASPTSEHYRPRYILSPNSSQNQVHQFADVRTEKPQSLLKENGLLPPVQTSHKIPAYAQNTAYAAYGQLSSPGTMNAPRSPVQPFPNGPGHQPGRPHVSGGPLGPSGPGQYGQGYGQQYAPAQKPGNQKPMMTPQMAGGQKPMTPQMAGGQKPMTPQAGGQKPGQYPGQPGGGHYAAGNNAYPPQNYPRQNFPQNQSAQNYPLQNQPLHNQPPQNYPQQNQPPQNYPQQNYPPHAQYQQRQGRSQPGQKPLPNQINQAGQRPHPGQPSQPAQKPLPTQPGQPQARPGDHPYQQRVNASQQYPRPGTTTGQNPLSFRSYDGNPYQYQVQSTYTLPAPGPAMHKGPGDARGQNPNAKSDSRQGGYRQY